MIRRAVAVAAAAALAASASAVAAPLELSAGFGAGARLGHASPLELGLSIDPQRLPSPVSEVRILYPRSLGLVSSGLGMAACRPLPFDFEQVIVDGSGLDGCSPNAVMGYGTLVAEVRLSDGQVIPEYATLALLSGPIDRGRLGLVVFIDGQRPFGGRIVLGGGVHEAPAPYGGALSVVVPVAPALVGVADIALVDLRLTVGAPRIVYYERVRGRMRAYRPEGIVLPRRCPSGGFGFKVRLRFVDGSRATAATTVRCPASA